MCPFENVKLNFIIHMYNHIEICTFYSKYQIQNRMKPIFQKKKNSSKYIFFKLNRVIFIGLHH